jgi:hypothetical protein
VLSAGSGPRQGPVGEELLLADDGEPDGYREGEVLGTSWHGAPEHDAFRRALERVTAARGRRFVPGDIGFADAREARLECARRPHLARCLFAAGDRPQVGGRAASTSCFVAHTPDSDRVAAEVVSHNHWNV